ncbi:hypothetical protein [Pseudomonas hunanensis]|uniref:Uncharacterized protein n=1 Tax=Pseudomonas hunanensis TaxID=1247546 RepID=A0ACC9MX99_9PSED|nr:hypothetical protein [Pseudomonas hunanensis]PKF23698.1 hypothetical protein CW309_26145 [Pseudomonas hunanensis]
MSFALISQFAGSLWLYLMNCSVALATAYGLGSIFKAPHVELALQGAVYSAYALCVFGVLNTLALIASAMRSRPRRAGEGS